MSGLQMRWEWEDAGAARGPELSATWARFAIEINGESVTHVHDQRTNAVRDAIYGPLYPIAEWLLAGWWPLLYEAGDESRQSAEFEGRHSLRYADEGYAMPDLWFVPVGDAVQATWRTRHASGQRVVFLASGAAVLERSQVEAVLREFIQAVIDRMADQHVANTFLQSEWSTYRQLDSEEMAFMRAAGSMGLDPLSLSEEIEREVLDAAERLPPELQEEFFSSALAQDLGKRLEWVEQSAAALSRQGSSQSELNSLRSTVQRQFTATGRPWDDGYRLARLTRDVLGLGAQSIDQTKITGVGLDTDIVWDPTVPARIDGLLGANAQNSPTFRLVKKHRIDSRRFMFCRALGEFISGEDNEVPQNALLTTAATARQKRNRAFAAEFLIPSDAIKSRISKDCFDDEFVENLAEEFVVSNHVVRHQLRNHRLMQSFAD